MSLKSSGSVAEPGGGGGGPILRRGYLKKLKTNKKKYFVLRAETAESSARLDYYDSERKFNSGQPPKRSILLKTCFNINKKQDRKHKHVIALYTKDDCFSVVLDNEEDLNSWLKALLSLQHGEETADGETPRPTFEHVWQIVILSRGVGTNFVTKKKKIIDGVETLVDDECHYRFCLTDKTLSVVKDLDAEPIATFPLNCIRSCGCLKNYIYLELGRSSTVGAGELWLETEDANIANNIHTTVYHAMNTNCKKREVQAHANEDDLGPHRLRSSSATESSKPSGMTTRSRPVGVTKPIPLTQGFGGRERCDSMPSRARTASETNHITTFSQQVKPYLIPHRPASFYGKGDLSHSPPTGSPVSPPSQSTDSAGSSLLSIEDGEGWTTEVDSHSVGRYGHSITPDEAIAEENMDDCPNSPLLTQGMSPRLPNNYVPMGPPTHSSDDGYVDMSPRGGRHATTSPAASLSSVTSGTPSTDMRFADYPLEKVSSYLTEEYDVNSAERPIRAYSVGSRPETMKYRNRLDSTRNSETRDRAFSVGSKSKKGHNRVLPPHGHVHNGPKSSSAPLLSNSRLFGSHSSIDPMDDLMEMDFSNKSSVNKNSGYMDMTPGSKTSINSGYVDMQPGNIDKKKAPEIAPYVDMRCGSSPAKPNFISLQPDHYEGPGDYMDMDPRKVRNHFKPSTSPLLSSISPSSNHPPTTSYMDMNFNNKNRGDLNLDHYSISPTKSCIPPRYPEGSPSTVDYMDMDFGAHRGNKSKTPTNEGYVEMTLGSKKSGNNSHQRQSSLDGASDYTNMSVSGNKKKDQPKRSSSKKETTRSLPIQIQATTANQVPKGSSPSSPMYTSMYYPRKYSTGTPPNKYLPLANNNSSPYSSLPRQRSRKNSRRDSKDSSSSSVTTPSSSSTIFPFSLNSPSSPVKPITDVKTPEPVAIKIPPGVLSAKYKGSSNTPTRDEYTVMDFGASKKAEEPSDYVNYAPAPKVNVTAGDYAVMKPGVTENSSGDYAIMDPTKSTKHCKFTTSDDYAYMQPGATNLSPMADYALMQPTAPSITTSTTGSITISRIAENRAPQMNIVTSSANLMGKMSSISLSEGGANCFRPIIETKEDRVSSPKVTKSDSTEESPYYEMLSANAKQVPRPSSVNSDKINPRIGFELNRPASVTSDSTRTVNSRPSSASSELCSSSSTLVGSRPESVNSDRIRPSSANVEGQLHYASLDLVSSTVEDDGTRSPRTSKSNQTVSQEQNQVPGEPGCTYADIDFVKSEGLKQSSVQSSKLKH